MKKTYQIPTLNQDIVFGECQLLVGTTIPVVPFRGRQPESGREQVHRF